MTDTRRPAPAGAGRRVQPRLDESLTGSVSHEMSTSDLSAAMPGRHQIGTVAGFGLECWPTSRRNGGRLPVGITGRLRRNTQSMDVPRLASASCNVATWRVGCRHLFGLLTQPRRLLALMRSADRHPITLPSCSARCCTRVLPTPVRPVLSSRRQVPSQTEGERGAVVRELTGRNCSSCSSF